MCDEAVTVKDRFREIFIRHRVYNALAFSDFMSTVVSTKNMLTRASKGTLSCPRAVLVNNFVMIANTIGPDTRLIFETPIITEPHYCVARAILHHLGLPYEAGVLDPEMTSHFTNLDNEMRRCHG